MAVKRAKEKHVRKEKFHFVYENIFASKKLIIIFFFLRRVGLETLSKMIFSERHQLGKVISFAAEKLRWWSRVQNNSLGRDGFITFLIGSFLILSLDGFDDYTILMPITTW